MTASCVLALLFQVSISPVFASDVTDPTRPPANFGSAIDSRAADTDAEPILQSVIISSGRRLAIINGQMVKTGDKYGEARVARITESEVVLWTGKSLQTLKLFPGIEKKDSPRRAEIAASGAFGNGMRK